MSFSVLDGRNPTPIQRGSYRTLVPSERRIAISKQRLLPTPIHSRSLDLEVLVREVSSNSASGSPVEESDLNQERLVNLLDGVGLFGQRRRQCVHSHRTTLVFLDDRQQQLTVDLVEAMLVDLKHFE